MVDCLKCESPRLLYAPFWQVRKRRERHSDWLLQTKLFPVSVTFRFSIQRTPWSWIGESHFLKSPGPLAPYLIFFFLLQSTLLSDLRPANHPILRFTQDRRIFRILLTSGLALGIVAGIETTSNSPNATQSSQPQALRITSVAIFLFLTLVQALQTGILATSSVSGMQNKLFKSFAEWPE